MRSLYCLFCLFTSLSLTPFALVAEEGGSALAAQKLLEAMGMEEAVANNIEASLDVQMKQFAEMGLGEEGLKALKSEMQSFMSEVMAYEDLESDLVEIYTEAFTAAELNELTAFYETPIGKKTMRVLPQLMVQGMELGQARVQARAPELQQRLTPIFEKYLPAE